MSITTHIGSSAEPWVTSPDEMYRAVKQYGIIPFFAGPVQGYSIEDLTPSDYWFDENDELGPWDLKIDVLQNGNIAYGKFLLGGKAAFATVKWYRELRQESGERNSVEVRIPKNSEPVLVRYMECVMPTVLVYRMFVFQVILLVLLAKNRVPLHPKVEESKNRKL